MAYLFVFNSMSGEKHKRKQACKIITQIQNDIYFITTTYQILYINDKQFDNNSILQIIKENTITHLILFGGDGTFQHIVNFIFRHYKDIFNTIIFGFMPMGSGNGLARNLNIPLSYKKFITCIKKNMVTSIDTILLNQSHLIIHNIGIGFDAMVADKFNQSKKRGGLNYLFLILKCMFKLPSYSLSITNCEKTQQRAVFMLTISNSQQLGMNFKIAPLAKLNDNKFDVVIIPKQPLIYVLITFMKYLANAGLHLSIKKINKVIYFQTEELQIINHNHAPIHFGGEPIKEILPFISCSISDIKIKCLTT